MSQLTTISYDSAQPFLTRWAACLRQLGDRLWHLDFVLVVLAALLAGLYLFDADQALRTASYIAGELAHIGPWLAGSVFIAAAAKATGADSMARAVTGRQSRMIVV